MKAKYVYDVVGRKFTAKKRDNETGLDFFEARYMSAPLGRFMSPDPVAGNRANPQSLNRYTYALNNPLKYIDPTGMIVEWADSACEEDETGCRTKAQRGYEKGLDKKLNSKNKKEREEGAKLKDTYNRLQNSDAIFQVINEATGGMSRGMIGYDGSKFTIALKGDTSAYGALSQNQKLGHEFEHGRQILDKELSFHNYNEGKWLPFAYDRTDEANAFAAGFMMEPINPQQLQNRFLRDLNQALTGGIESGAKYLGGSNSPYRGLPLGPDNVKIISPSIYQVPK